MKPDGQYQSLTEFTNVKLEKDKPEEIAELNATGTFSLQESLVNQTNEEDESVDQPKIKSHHDSGYFTKDFRILKNATYGRPNAAALAAKKLQEEFADEFNQNNVDDFDDSREQKVPEVLVSFREEESKDVEPSYEHIDMD